MRIDLCLQCLQLCFHFCPNEPLFVQFFFLELCGHALNSSSKSEIDDGNRTKKSGKDKIHQQKRNLVVPRESVPKCQNEDADSYLRANKPAEEEQEEENRIPQDPSEL